MNPFGLWASTSSAGEDSVLCNIPVIIFTASELNEEQIRKLKTWSIDLLYKSEIKSEEFNFWDNLTEVLTKIVNCQDCPPPIIKIVGMSKFNPIFSAIGFLSN